MSPSVQLVEEPHRVAAGLSPLRRRILDALDEPASATVLAGRLGLTRQKVNYHLRLLEGLGLVELVELRQRRGCTERVVRRSADFVVDPGVLAGHRSRLQPGRPGGAVAARDRHAAEHLIEVASGTVREVARMQAAAGAHGRRLLTFTVETEVAFARPADIHAFTDAVAEALGEVAARFHEPTGRAYRVVLGGHPAPSAKGPS